MVDTGEIRTQIEQAKQSVVGERQIIEKRRLELKKAEKYNLEDKNKIPKQSQRLMRSGMYSGLEGRKRRQQIESIKEKLDKRGKEINIIKEGLTKYEKEQIEPFEVEIGKREEEVMEYERHQAAIALAEKVYSSTDSNAIFMLENEPLAKSYYWQLGTTGGEPIEVVYGGRTDEVSIGTTTPTSFSFLNPKGTYDVSSGTYTSTSGGKQSMSLSDAGKLGANIFNLPTIKVSLQPPRDIPKTDLIKDFRPPMSIDLQKSNINDLFRTTGSPMRITKLTSYNSKGHQQSIRPPIIKPMSLFVPKKVEPKKTINKVVGKNLFSSNNNFLLSNNKKKKKVSMWGI